jgi:hypothetical protein
LMLLVAIFATGLLIWRHRKRGSSDVDTVGAKE